MLILWVYLILLAGGSLAEVSAFGVRNAGVGSSRRAGLRDQRTELRANRRGISDTALNFRRDVMPEMDIEDSALHHREKHTGDALVSHEVVIREAKRNEIGSVVSLRVNVFYPELRTMAQFHQRIMDKLCNRILRRGSVCFAAFRDTESASERGKAGALFGNILGTIEVSHNDFIGTVMENVGSSRKLYCCDLAVQPNVRRQGLATKLLKAVEAYAFKMGYDELYLHVEKGNAAAEKLYLREGYQVIPSLSWAVEFTEGHLQKGYDNYVFLWKRIDAETDGTGRVGEEREGDVEPQGEEVSGWHRSAPEVVMID